MACHPKLAVIAGERRMAGSTGLEPAASAVTGQRSNQLNYDPETFENMIGALGKIQRAVSSVVEHRLYTPAAAGSNPAPPTTHQPIVNYPITK